jgi:hypothetical protein
MLTGSWRGLGTSAYVLSAQLPAEALSMVEFRAIRPLPGIGRECTAKVWHDNRFVLVGGKFFNMDAAKALRDWLNEAIPPQSDASGEVTR